ncbi:hypothetical protein [Serratia marcescens]|uniref:hypothetical protein n=1 Tax=Serratia marcescens TaxID=615 RepID=UPI0002B86942|nr:hypothetical protein [Serratia marcescens]EMF04572.1 hypothetical protein F518_17335 [Serratia marcescens VGH107]
MVDKISLLLKLTPPGWNDTKEQQDKYLVKLGEEGERLTREILNDWGTIYFSIEQNKGTKPKWISSIAGKRPDFIAFTHEENQIVLIESKFYKNQNSYFYLKKEEVEKCKNLVNHLAENGITVEFLFIFPIGGMAGHNFFAYSLDEVSSAGEELCDNIPYKKLPATQAFKK